MSVEHLVEHPGEHPRKTGRVAKFHAFYLVSFAMESEVSRNLLD